MRRYGCHLLPKVTIATTIIIIRIIIIVAVVVVVAVTIALRFYLHHFQLVNAKFCCCVLLADKIRAKFRSAVKQSGTALKEISDHTEKEQNQKETKKGENSDEQTAPVERNLKRRNKNPF